MKTTATLTCIVVIALVAGCDVQDAAQPSEHECVAGTDVAEGPPSEWAYVVNSDEGTVSVIDPRRCGTVTTIDLGGRPTAANASASGNFVYVANETLNAVQIIDTREQAVVETVDVIDQPTRLRISFDHRTIWVSGEAGGFSLIDIKSNKAVGTVEAAVGDKWLTMTDSEPYIAYVAAVDESRVDVIDVSSGQTLTSVVTPGAPSVADFSSLSQRVYVCTENGVSVLETTGPMAQQVVKELELGPCNELEFDHAGRFAWVMLEDGSVATIDVQSDDVVAHEMVGGQPRMVRFIGDSVAVVDASGGQVHIFDAATKELRDRVEFTGMQRIVESERIVIESLDNRHIYVLSPNENLVRVVDVLNGEVRGTIEVGDTPTSLVVAGPVGGTCC